MQTLIQDIRYALRTLAAQRGFSAVAAIVLALGIGANTAIFSVVQGVLLRPLPYGKPERLMHISESTASFGHMSVAYRNFTDWRENSHSFSHMAAYRWDDYDLTGSGQAEHLSAKMVSADFFRTLGIHPVAGRDFDTAEDRLGTTPVVVLGGGFWQRRFGSSPAVIGRQITMSNRDYTVIGVVPADFQLRGKADVYTLLGQYDDLLMRSREMHPGIFVVGALKPEVTMAQAQGEMTSIAARLAEAYPKSNARHGVNVEPLAPVIVGNVRPTLLVLVGAVGFVLLIACANVANLLLARATGRRKELAIRAAIGASRGRVVRQLLTESVVVALAGGAAGVAVAAWGTRAVLAAVPGGLPRVEEIGVNGWVMGFALAVSLLTGVVFGLAPALQVSARDLHETLKEGGRGSTAGPNRLRSLLVAAEVAAALVLLAGAGLMLRTVGRLHAVDPGFNAHNVLTFSVGLSPASMTDNERVFQAIDQLTERIRAVPGVKSAAVATLLPLSGSDNEIPFYVEGRPRPTSQGDMTWALLYAAGPDYVKTMGIPLLRGRYLTPEDNNHTMPAILIDEVMARSVFPHEDPLGKNIRVADMSGSLGPEANRPLQIVGIVGHVKHWGLDSDATARVRNEIYLPFAQIPSPFVKSMAAGNVFVARTTSDVLRTMAGVRQAVAGLGADQPVYAVQPMERILADSIAGRRFSMLLLAIFAGLALLLAGVGIYGVISYTVAQRTHEIGIRMALGARPGDVVRSVIASGMIPVLGGLAVGLGASLLLTRLMASMLYGVKASDPATFAGVAAAMAAVGLAASYAPARRATRIDPTVALHHE